MIKVEHVGGDRYVVSYPETAVASDVKRAVEIYAATRLGWDVRLVHADFVADGAVGETEYRVESEEA